MKKKWFLIIVILLLTGCSVEYNVDINKENVTEQVIIYESQDFYDIYSKTSKLNALKELLSYEEETLNNNNYKYEIVGDKNPYILITREYRDITDYCQNTIFYKDYFDNLKCEGKDDIISIETLDYHKIDAFDPSKYLVDNLSIKVKSYYNIDKSNSSSIDSRNNVYSWNMSNNEEFKVNLDVDTNSIFIKPVYYYVGIIIIIIVIVWIIIICYYKNRKKVLNKKKI